MAEINLTQEEADTLHAMEKVRVDNTEWDLPDFGSGGYISVPLISSDKKENFILDIRRGRIDIKKQTYQNRAREAIVLARLDFGAPHRNPPELGGNEVGVPHLHIYKEGFGSKYAIDIPKGLLSDLNDPWKILNDFMKYCNITQSPNFRRGLFS